MSWTELHPLVQEAARTSLAVAFLVIIVLAIRKPFARRFGAKAAYTLWLVPLIRFVLPPLPANFTLTGWLRMQPEATEAPAPFVFTQQSEQMVFMPAPPVEVPAVAAIDPVIETAPSWLETAWTTAPVWLAVIWLAGAVFWIARSLRQQHIFRRLIDFDSQPASPRLVTEGARIAKGLGLKRLPDVRVSLLCSGPLVTGLTRPVVLLPQWFEEDYDIREQNEALIHELTHLRRGDLWAFQAARIVAATQWFNPVIHLALQAFRTDQESACDADVLRQDQISPADYGRTLVKAARLARPSDRRIAAASLTLAHPIKERLIMMQHPNPSLRSRLTGTALATVLGSAALFATASCMSAEAQKTAETENTRTFVFNGISASDHNRQIVLLSDPFARLQPKLDAIHNIEFDFEAMDIPEPPTPPEPMEFEFDMDFLEGLDEVLEFSSTDGEGHQIFIMKSGESEEEFEARIEAWSDEVEARAEAWAEKIEARSEEFERKTEIITMKFEKDMEAWEAEHSAKFAAFEARMSETFDEEFEAEMEAAGEAVENLAEQCTARDTEDPTPEIVSAVDAKTGETYRALCVNGGGERLRSDALAEWVQARSDLSDAEKQAFMEKRNQNHSISISINGYTHGEGDDEDRKVIIKRVEKQTLEGGDEE